MKRLIAAVMALVFVAAPALADPAPRVAPSLAAHTAEFDQAILNPAPGVYVAVGYGLANSIMVVGRTGVVIIDTLDSLDEARKVWAAFEPLAGGRPVVAIIYTHNHNDHINGASAFPLAPGGKITGPINVTAPNPVTNREFTKTLGTVLGRPTILPMPALAARLALGEMAKDLLLASSRVMPYRLSESSYQFQFPSLEGALQHLLNPTSSSH